jgi:hypothetical protein
MIKNRFKSLVGRGRQAEKAKAGSERRIVRKLLARMDPENLKQQTLRQSKNKQHEKVLERQNGDPWPALPSCLSRESFGKEGGRVLSPRSEPSVCGKVGSSEQNIL